MKCYILKRNDTGQYYRGNNKRNFRDRWTEKLEQAKKYKRQGDVANAVTTMRDYSAYREVKNVTFTVLSYSLEYIAEYEL
jgi:hypothetical protein